MATENGAQCAGETESLARLASVSLLEVSELTFKLGDEPSRNSSVIGKGILFLS